MSGHTLDGIVSVDGDDGEVSPDAQRWNERLRRREAMTPEERRADTRIRDAAPALLEACEALLAVLWTHVGKRNVRKHYRLMIAEVAAQNAIRKAKGGDPQ